MRAEIVSIGTELLLGHTVNSDAAIVARELAALGIDLMHIQTVGDNRERLSQALAMALARSDLVITTGGLGPTDDDLTKSVVAETAGVQLVPDAESMRRLREYFGSRAMGSTQERQALMPEGATVFYNHKGTAPGYALSLAGGKAIILLPGPPVELSHMLVASVVPWLARLSNQALCSTMIRTFGIGEGDAAERISDLMAGANPTVAPYAQGGEMFIRVSARAADEASARALAEPLISEIRRRLGDVVYGIDVASLEEVVLRELLARGMTIATAESCTGGLLAKRITDLPGASDAFGLGLVAYANTAKEKLLHVPAAMLAEFGAVSPEVATAMAGNVRKLAQSDIGLGITGIAGPTGATAQKPLGLVHIALATSDAATVSRHTLKGKYPGRDWVRSRAASIALDMTRRFLAGLPIPAEY